ncbi:unnamed protein product [Ectocarpus fasciculatus]
MCWIFFEDAAERHHGHERVRLFCDGAGFIVDDFLAACLEFCPSRQVCRMHIFEYVEPTGQAIYFPIYHLPASGYTCTILGRIFLRKNASPEIRVRRSVGRVVYWF